jgi:hypothetical protein
MFVSCWADSALCFLFWPVICRIAVCVSSETVLVTFLFGVVKSDLIKGHMCNYCYTHMHMVQLGIRHTYAT